MSRRIKTVTATFVVSIVLSTIALLSILLATSANAGQTGGFAPYAKQGIVNHLNAIYGSNGNPYKVTCSEADSFSNTTGVNDSIVCHVRSKLWVCTEQV